MKTRTITWAMQQTSRAGGLTCWHRTSPMRPGWTLCGKKYDERSDIQYKDGPADCQACLHQEVYQQDAKRKAALFKTPATREEIALAMKRFRGVIKRLPDQVTPIRDAREMFGPLDGTTYDGMLVTDD